MSPEEIKMLKSHFALCITVLETAAQHGNLDLDECKITAHHKDDPRVAFLQVPLTEMIEKWKEMCQ